MDRVLDRLWIGATDDFRAPLATLGFSGVVDLRDGAAHPVVGVEVCSIKNRDGDPWDADQVEVALSFIAEKIQDGKVLVACAAGMSRSACIVIGYLVRIGFEEPRAFAMVREARPRILPVPKMLESVLKAVHS